MGLSLFGEMAYMGPDDAVPPTTTGVSWREADI
jgi:hypothetical protein